MRELLKKLKIDYLLVNSTNEYLVEYSELSENARYKLTGFSGSTGDALITSDKIYLFVDGRYHIQAEQEAKKGINTKKTIELGSKYSPDDICMPFKYNLGNYIEGLEQGADILIQAGGGCRYGYYAELQEQILKDLGYQFEFINLIQNNHISLSKLYKVAKKINPKLNILKYIYYLIQGLLIMITMDKLDKYLRENNLYQGMNA